MKWFFYSISFSSAKDAEKKINDEHKACKAAFIQCSKLEDEALEYMIKCYTSAATIKANLKELLKIKDACTKLKTNQEAIVSTSTSSGRRVKRQKNSESVTCSTYITQVSTLNIVSIQKCYWKNNDLNKMFKTRSSKVQVSLGKAPPLWHSLQQS